MNPGLKMMLLTDRENTDPDRYDHRKREHHEERGHEMYDNYGMDEGYYDDMESRRRYRRDSRGRFKAEMDNDDVQMGGYHNQPFPVYEEHRRVNPIGFNADGNEIRTNYGMNATHKPSSEMEYRQSSQMGGYSSSKGAPMTKEMAEEWTRSMRNEDGTKGPHWTMEQVKQVMAQKGIKYDLAEFYAILNAMYSDYCSVLKKHGVNNIDFYVDLAAAWLNDSDAVPNKAAMYYECIVKHE